MCKKALNQPKEDNFYKVLFTAVIIIALILLVIVCVNFFLNQVTLSHVFISVSEIIKASINGSGSHTSSFTTQNVSTQNSLIDAQIEYIETLTNLHNQASGSQLMVFIYGFLSSVLIGVAMFFLNKGDEKIKKQGEEIQKQEELIQKRAYLIQEQSV